MVGFVHDFNLWVTSTDEEQTTTLIQDTILPHTEQWARQSGATFEADKPGFIHSTKKARVDDTRAIPFGGRAILPQQSVKILGFTLDQRLAMDEHVSRVVTRGTRACLSLQTAEDTKPAQMRQPGRSYVLPIIDYAAPTWYGPGKRVAARLVDALDKLQRLGARIILRA